MWNAKKTYFFGLACLICFILVQSCRKKIEKEVAINFEFVGADKYFAPPADETVAILLYPAFQKRDINIPMVLIGNKEQAEKIMGRSLEPKKLIERRDWLEKIMEAYTIALKEAGEKEYSGNGIVDGYIFFITPKITPKKGYMRSIGIDEDENAVCDQYMKSGMLKTYFDELGLVDELLADRTEFVFVSAAKYHIPPTDKIVAILLYLPNSDSDRPVALFGDKELAEKLIGRKLEPKKLIADRDWLEKIMDAYEIALKEAEQRKFHHGGDTSGEIIFITLKKGYMKTIGVDENSVYDRYMGSGQLKAYFDELGLSEEFLAREPNKALQR